MASFAISHFFALSLAAEGLDARIENPADRMRGGRLRLNVGGKEAKRTFEALFLAAYERVRADCGCCHWVARREPSEASRRIRQVLGVTS